MSWVLVVAGCWLVLSVVVGLVLGAVIARRDRQVPPSGPAPAVPRPRRETSTTAS